MVLRWCHRAAPRARSAARKPPSLTAQHEIGVIIPMSNPDITTWPPAAAANTTEPWLNLPLLLAVGRGVRGVCPNCGRSPLFIGFLRVVSACPTCPAPLGQVRADDMPPYVVIALVGHIAVASVLVLESLVTLSVAAECAIVLPLATAAAFALIRPVKGGVVGLMLKLGVLSPDPRL